MKTLLSLLTVAVAATSAQLSYPYGLPGSPNNNGLVYAAGYGYSNYGLRNEGAPPNNPFVFRTAADVFTPEAVPAAVGTVYNAAAPYTPYIPANSFAYNAYPFNYGFGGYYGNYAGYAPFGLPRYLPAAFNSVPATAVTAAIPAAAPIAVEAPIAPASVKESIENEVAVVDADSSPVVVANEADLRLRQIFPVFESGMGRSSTGNQPITFLRPDQLAQQVPALKSDGSDGGVIVPDFDLTPSFYNGLPRFAVRPSPVTQ